MLYVTCLLALGKGNNIIKTSPTSNNPKVSNAVPGTFRLAQQGRRQLSPAVPTSSALWASQHFLPLSSAFVLGVLFQFLSLWLMLPERQETSLVSLKCLLKIGAYPRGGFQSPCECLEPHTSVFCGRRWLQLALQNWGQVFLPVPERCWGKARHLHPPHLSGVWLWRSHKLDSAPVLDDLQAPCSAQEQCSLGFLSYQRCLLQRPSLHILSPGALIPSHGKQTPRPLCAAHPPHHL